MKNNEPKKSIDIKEYFMDRKIKTHKPKLRFYMGAEMTKDFDDTINKIVDNAKKK